MTFFQALILILKYLPTFIATVKAGEDFIQTLKKLQALDAGETKAQATKDTSDIEKLFNPDDDAHK